MTDDPPTAARLPPGMRRVVREDAQPVPALAEESTDPWDVQAGLASGLGPVPEAWLANESRTAPSSWAAMQSLREVDSKASRALCVVRVMLALMCHRCVPC